MRIWSGQGSPEKFPGGNEWKSELWAAKRMPERLVGRGESSIVQRAGEEKHGSGERLEGPVWQKCKQSY